jgi:hypothetical protein
VLDELPGATVYQIDLAISDDLLSVSGHQAVCHTNREGVPLSEIAFRLFPNLLGGAMTVSNVRVDGQAVATSQALADSALRLSLADGLDPEETVTIEMDFQVVVPQEMGRNYGLFGLFDGVLSLHEVYPAIPVYDDEGWNVELPPPQGDVTYYDASFYQVQVTAPSRLTVVTSGVETARQERGARQVLTFAAGPARGFYLAASEDYVRVTETMGETTVNSYARAGLESGADLALDVATRALESYSGRFGVYPYTEFDVVSTPMLALGMEYAGLTAITQAVYDLDGEIRGVPASVMMEGTVGHEVAHQWFYNVVGNDQIDEPWLDEAVVQYATGLYYLDRYGQDGYRGWRGSWVDRWERVDRAEIPIGLPVAAYEDGSYGAIVYGRGPLFVEALAKEMGQETFDAFLRDYYQSHTWDIGTGEAFQELAERHCQCDLGPLFSQWVYPDEGARTLRSLRQVDDYPLYAMRYQGPYAERAASAPSAGWAAEVDRAADRSTSPGWGCSLFAALGDAEHRLYGRNFDWRYSPALLLFTEPPDGYASVSMVDLAYLVDPGDVDRLTELPLEARQPLLDAPLWPFDGMNEQGLVVGMAAVPGSEMPYDAGRETIDSLRVIREILDQARDVEEAIAVMKRFNVDWGGGPPLHYLIADASGASVLVEFYDGEMVLIPGPAGGPWHVATNHLRAPLDDGSPSGCWRYDAVRRQLKKAGGSLTVADAADLLADVAQENTQWSVVYGLDDLSVHVALGRAFEQIHAFRLGAQ